MPVLFTASSRWQYGVDSHTSPSRLMFGSALIAASTQSGVTLPISHSVLDGSSQCLIGQNVTSTANILQLDGNGLELPNPSGVRIRFPLIERNFHLYLSAGLFCDMPVLLDQACTVSTHSPTPSFQDVHPANVTLTTRTVVLLTVSSTFCTRNACPSSCIPRPRVFSECKGSTLVTRVLSLASTDTYVATTL